MKNRLLSLLFAVGILAATALPVVAAIDPAINVFGAGSTNGATTLSWVTITARSGNNGTPVVTFLNATSDKASSKVQAYRVTAQAQCNYTNTTVTIPVVSTNQGVNWNSGTVLIRHMLDDTYEKRTLTSGTGSTNIVITAASLGTVIPGDILYFVTTTGAQSIPCGNATLSLNSVGGIIVGQQGKPLLLEIDSTTTGTFNAAAGFFQPPVSVPKLGSSATGGLGSP